MNDQMKTGSGISVSCQNCNKERELTIDEVTMAPTPEDAATLVLNNEGWEGTWHAMICTDCVVKEADEKQEASLEKAKTEAKANAEGNVVRPGAWDGKTMEFDDEAEAERPDFELSVKPAVKLQPLPDEEPEKEHTPEPIVIFEEKDIRIVMTTDKFDGPPEEILIVERAHGQKDAMGKTRYTNIGLMHTVWVIQELARALFERETGQRKAPPQNRVWLGGDRYVPLPNVID